MTGKTYNVYGIASPIVPADAGVWDWFTGNEQIVSIADTNGNGEPDSGDYGITKSGQTVQINVTGTISYFQNPVSKVDRSWIEARLRGQSRYSAAEARLAMQSAPLVEYEVDNSRLQIAHQELYKIPTEYAPRYAASQWRQAKGYASAVTDNPVATAVVAGGLVVVLIHPKAAVVRNALSLAGAVASPVAGGAMLMDRVGGALRDEPTGEHDLAIIPTMFAGAPAFEKIAADAPRAISAAGSAFQNFAAWIGAQSSSLTPAYLGAHGGILTAGAGLKGVSAVAAGGALPGRAPAALSLPSVFMSQAHSASAPNAGTGRTSPAPHIQAKALSDGITGEVARLGRAGSEWRAVLGRVRKIHKEILGSNSTNSSKIGNHPGSETFLRILRSRDEGFTPDEVLKLFDAFERAVRRNESLEFVETLLRHTRLGRTFLKGTDQIPGLGNPIWRNIQRTIEVLGRSEDPVWREVALKTAMARTKIEQFATRTYLNAGSGDTTNAGRIAEEYYAKLHNLIREAPELMSRPRPLFREFVEVPYRVSARYKARAEQAAVYAARRALEMLDRLDVCSNL